MTSARTHVHSKLAKVRVELTGEAQASRDTGHDDGNEVVEVTVRGRGELERTEADVVERLVVNAERLVRVLDELVNGEGRVVRLNDGVRHLRRGNNGEGGHHTIRVFFPDLRDQEGTHARTGTTTQRVGDLEACNVQRGPASVGVTRYIP